MNHTTNHSNRRTFMMAVIAAGSTVAVSRAMAQAALPPLQETDAQASALGYKPDSTKVDAAKYPKHDNTQRCGTCQLFQGKPKETSGPCPLFPGKQVQATGWCSAYAKKPA